MKTATKNRQTNVSPVQTQFSSPRVHTMEMEQVQDSPAVRQAWVRLYEAVVGKRRVASQRGLVHQH
ncbi:MAG TPA: hypothetical protein VMZ27_15325 [Candidatus Saccharimonadales bacterium]|nr:hypothetical protein [Candidatus Saccharimonadales bacterium]